MRRISLLYHLLPGTANAVDGGNKDYAGELGADDLLDILESA